MTEEFLRFTAYFKGLTLQEQMQLSPLFREATKGRLSPFNSPTPVAVALVPLFSPTGLCLLGGIRGIEPGKHGLAFPGGYLEELENGPEAVARELFEETSLVTKPEDFTLSHTVMSKTNSLLLFYIYNKILDSTVLNTLPLNTEVLAHLPVYKDTPLIFKHHEEAKKQFFNML